MGSDILLQRAKALKLHGLIAHWEEIKDADWLEKIIHFEETERTQRSHKRRLDSARLGRFKPLSHFDWTWPKKCDREVIEDLMTLGFLKEATNIIFCGPNGVGKTTIASNIAHQAVIRGHAVLFTTAGNMLSDLSAQDGENAFRRRIKYYVKPKLLCIDEVGYLSYSNRCADLLFEVISQRYQEKSTLVTTNKPFSEWGSLFLNASCVVSLIDRLVHNSEIISIEADSFRLKEAKEKTKERKEIRVKNQKTKKE